MAISNEFNKEERVAFEQILEGFEDAEIMSKNVSKYGTDQTMMERTQDTIWRPQPYIMNSFDGRDMRGNFHDKTQLSVPASINIEKSVPWHMSATELRDQLQENRLGKSARQRLGSDINVAILSLACNYGSLVVARSAVASGFDDVAMIEAIMNETGVSSDDRILALSTRDYNGMASNLANRSDIGAKKSIKAYEESYVGRIASFETWKLDYSERLGAAAGGAITMDTRTAANNFHIPIAVTSSPTVGERVNHDNRFQNIVVSGTANVAPGDCFTIAGITSVHHITKLDTGQLKTFRVVENVNGTTLKITPAIVSAQTAGASQSEIQYQNCVLEGTGSANAVINWLNTKSAYMNPFWKKEALEILPGRYAIPSDAGASVIRGRTDSGIELCMTKQFDIESYEVRFRLDTRFGVVNKSPEMSGVLIFDQ